MAGSGCGAGDVDIDGIVGSGDTDTKSLSISFVSATEIEMQIISSILAASFTFLVFETISVLVALIVFAQLFFLLPGLWLDL
jgi:hypothetical protein